MKPETLFLILNNLATAVWLLMIFTPKWKVTQTIISTFSVVIILGIAYTFIIVTSFGKINFMDFSSLEGIMKLLHSSDEWGTNAFWFHYLAFDLFVGTWILKDSQKSSIPHLLVIPCLLFTFMLGPFGFVLYQILKFIRAKFFKTQVEKA